MSETPIEVCLCGKAFVCEWHWYGEDPYECEHCGRTYEVEWDDYRSDEGTWPYLTVKGLLTEPPKDDGCIGVNAPMQ